MLNCVGANVSFMDFGTSYFCDKIKILHRLLRVCFLTLTKQIYAQSSNLYKIRNKYEFNIIKMKQ